MSNTISRVLYQNNHLSRPDVATRLKQPTRDTTGSRIISVRSCFGWGLHSRFCYQKCGELLPRLFTLTCYSRRLFSVALSVAGSISHKTPRAFLLGSTAPCGARTFLPYLKSVPAARRPVVICIANVSKIPQVTIRTNAL